MRIPSSRNRMERFMVEQVDVLRDWRTGREVLFLKRRYSDVAVGNGTVIALEHDGAGGGLATGHSGGGGALHFDILVEDLSIEFHDQKFRIGGLFSCGIKHPFSPIHHKKPVAFDMSKYHQ